MDSAGVLLKLFLLPRSRFILALCLLVLVSGTALSPLVNMLAVESKTWVAQQCASWILLICGISLGSTLRRVRTWSPAMFVPGLLKRHAWAALALTVLLWLFYVIPMVLTDTLAGFPVSLSLLLGVAAMLMATGIFKRIAFAWLLFVPVVLSDQWREMALAALLHPAAELVTLLLTGLFAAVLLNRYPAMSGDVSTVGDVNNKLPRRSLVPTLFYAMPLVAMSASRAFQATFNHSRQQAWISAGACLLLVNFVSLVFYLLGGGEPSTFVMISAAMCGIFAVSAPLTFRFLFDDSRELLWLAAVFDARQTQIHRSLLSLQRPAIRLCLLNTILIMLLSQVAYDNTLLGIALTMMIMAPAGGTLLLATSLVLAPREKQWQSGAEFLFGIFMLMQMLLLASVAVVLPVSLGLIPGVVTGLVIAVVLTLLVARVAGVLLARRLWLA